MSFNFQKKFTSDWAKICESSKKIYEKYLDQSKPARTTFQVARLPLAARIEIDAVAMI